MIRSLFLLPLLFLVHTSRQSPRQHLAIGAKVPPLTCSDVNGTSLSWDRWKESAVVLFFHSADMSYSRRGLHELISELKKATELEGRFGILVVSNGRRELGSLTTALEKTGVRCAITVDPDRDRFRDYRVVAFPSVFCIDRNRKIVDVIKGYGPLLPTRVVQATKLAAGLIDRKAFAESVSPAKAPPRGENLLKVSRSIRMVRQLMAAGMLEEARDALLRVLGPDTEHPEAVAILAKVSMRLKRTAEARSWLERLARVSPGSRDLRILRARLAIASGDPEKAEKEIAGLGEQKPEIAVLKGRVLELRGKFKEAARIYRNALESLLERAN